MFVDPVSGSVGRVSVISTSNGGHPPEFWAERATQRIVSVSSNLPPAIREQAAAFQQHIAQLVLHYMKEAIRSDRSTVCKALTDAGYPDLAHAIRNI